MNTLFIKTLVVGLFLISLRLLADTTHTLEPISLSYLLEHCSYFPKMVHDTLAQPTNYSCEEVLIEADTVRKHVTYRVNELAGTGFQRTKEVIKGENVGYPEKPVSTFYCDEQGNVDSIVSRRSSNTRSDWQQYVWCDSFEKNYRKQKGYHYSNITTDYISYNAEGVIDSAYSQGTISTPKFSRNRRSNVSAALIPSGRIQIFAIDIFDEATNRSNSDSVVITTVSGKARIAYYYRAGTQPEKIVYAIAQDSSIAVTMIGEVIFQYENDRLTSRSLYEVHIAGDDTAKTILELTENRYSEGLLSEQRFYNYRKESASFLVETHFKFDQKRRIVEEINRSYDSLLVETRRSETRYNYDDDTEILQKKESLISGYQWSQCISKSSQSIKVENHSSEEGVYNLYSALGRSILKKEILGKSSLIIPYDNLSSGIYLGVFIIGRNKNCFTITIP